MITKFGKVIITETEIDINGFRFEAISKELAAIEALSTVIDMLQKERESLIDNHNIQRGTPKPLP